MAHGFLWNILPVALISFLAACTSGPARRIAVPSPPRQVDAGVDNRVVLAQLEPALIGSMQISGAAVSLRDAELVRVPKVPARRTEGEIVVVEGVSDGGRISTSVAVPDQRLNAEEHGGLVRLTDQQLPFALPLTERIDHLRVRLPEGGAPIALDVRQVFARHCRNRNDDPLCSTPQASPKKTQ